MKRNEHAADLPGSVARKLHAIRRRAIGLALLEGLSFTAAALLGAMLAAMAIDWAVGWFDARARYTFTILAIAAVMVVFVFRCLRPLGRKRTIISTARDVDALVPQLQERWSTVTELAQSQDTPEVRGSEALIRKVASEAEFANAHITPETIISARPLVRAGCWLAAAAALLAALFAANFTQTVLLLQRFWMPGSNISLTQVSALPADGWVPKGESLTLNATVKGRVQKSPAKLFLRPERGGERTMAMTPRTGATGGFQHSIDDVSESFAYRVRAGDGQTPWHRITAVDRPKISEVKLTVTPPAYSRLPKEEKNSLPSAVQVLEGSQIEIGFRSDQPLERMLLDFGNGQSARLSAGPDNWYQFRARPTNSFTLAAAAINKFNLENKNKPSCRVTVYEDLPPSVKILEPSDDLTVLPGEKVNVTFEASDDLGLARAELIIATTKANGDTNSVTIPVELETDAGKKQFRKTVPLDPDVLGLKHGDQLSYVVQVTDTKQTPASASSTETRAETPGQPSSPQRAGAPHTKDAGQNQVRAKPEQDQQLADAAKNEEKEAQHSETNQDSQPGSDTSSSLAKAAHQQSPASKQNNGSERPPHDMAMRMLDAGQSSACKPRNITVDAWAGAFEGEKRKKLEIAIDPVLQRLNELLTQAQEKTDSLKQPAASAQGLQEPHSAAWNEAKEHLLESQHAIGDLKSRTAGTAYAFIGLQLHNINEAHLAPAIQSLVAVSIPAAAASNNVARIDQASFHIRRAREMLADLTRTYETVKRDQQIADAMQRLNKMYQIFLEDTQALLGSSKGPINAYDRKIAEVDDEFVQKLKELLEEKKKIMAELARLLSEDPRMLRRYMAMLELQGTSYRDQMTLLAERQKQVQQQVAKWNATAENERPALLPEFRESYSPQQRDVVRDATRLRENMETWLPLDVPADDPQVKAVLTRAEKIVQLTAESAQAQNTNAAHQALAELRALRETLPRLNEIHSTNTARMTAHVANRLADVETLITAQSGQVKMAESFNEGDFPKVAEIVQSRITQDTVVLGEKLEATETQIAQMSDAIAEKAAQLNQITQTDIIQPQGTSLRHLSVSDVKAAEEPLNTVVPAFARAEQTFDELMRLIIAKLDEAPPPGAVGQAPGLEAILSLLRDEQKAAEGLGIPCRPINISLMTDWLRPGSNPGQGMGQAQAQAAQAQAQQAKAETERLAKQARDSAQKALAEARQNDVTDGANARNGGEAWNKLVSQLQKDLLQGRDNTPPEQYRQAIENYFKIISDSAGEAPK